MRRLIALTCAIPFALAACGGDDEKESTPAPSSSGGGEATTLDLTAQEKGDEAFGFDHKSLDASAGKVTIKLTLPDGLKAPHAIAIDGEGSGDTAQAGGTSEVTADLKAGTYTFYCPVGDHREEGMEGTLTVK
jgi:plastocyanin